MIKNNFSGLILVGTNVWCYEDKHVAFWYDMLLSTKTMVQFKKGLIPTIIYMKLLHFKKVI